PAPSAPHRALGGAGPRPGRCACAVMLGLALTCGLAGLAVGVLLLLALVWRDAGFRRRWLGFTRGLMARTEKPLFRIAYTLYTRTRLGYIFHKKQLKKTRDYYPSGHSIVCPKIINGGEMEKLVSLNALKETKKLSHVFSFDASDMSRKGGCNSGSYSHHTQALGSQWRKQGRIFEGSSSLMLSSLDIVASLGDETLLWPGHEYAQDNLMFAASVEPNNPAIFNKLDWVLHQRHDKHCTCPSTIGEEKEYNPFLRTHSSDLHNALEIERELDEDSTSFRSRVLEEVRKHKDIFNYR
ncbi:hypothetical protein scyTo_0020160, partial [Scyliorhinus torazame]|nr:hypothetical protein [Scyliorhinus torazame]